MQAVVIFGHYSLAWLSAANLYIHGPAWTSITLIGIVRGYQGGFFLIGSCYHVVGHGDEIRDLSLSACVRMNPRHRLKVG